MFKGTQKTHPLALTSLATEPSQLTSFTKDIEAQGPSLSYSQDTPVILSNLMYNLPRAFASPGKFVLQ